MPSIKKKIIHIISGLNNGGAEKSLYNIIKNDQIPRRHIVISLTKGGMYYNLLKELDTTIFELNLNNKFNYYKILLIFYIIFINPNAIIQTWMYHSDIIGLIVGKILRRKVFWNIRHSNFDKISFKYKLILSIHKLLSRYPYKIICCAESIKKYYTELGYPDYKFITIYNGINFTHLKKIKIPYNNKINKILNIGFIGRWSDQKNYPFLFKVIRTMKNSFFFNKFKFELIGHNINFKNKELIEQIKRNNIFSNINLNKEIENMSFFYSRCDMIFSCSFYGEGFPNILAEALAFDIPCIAYDSGDAKLILNKYGKIYNSKNHRNVARMIIKYLNTDLKSNKIKSKTYLKYKYDISSMIQEYNYVWQK